MDYKLIYSIKNILKDYKTFIFIFIMSIFVNLISSTLYFSSYSFQFLLYSEGIVAGLLDIFKNYLPELGQYLLLSLVTLYLGSIIMTISINALLGARNKEFSYFRGQTRVFGFNLFLVFVSHIFLLVSIFLFNLNLIGFVIFEILALLLVISIFTRLFYLPVILVETKLGIKGVVRDSFSLSEGKFISIIVFAVVLVFFNAILVYLFSSIFSYLFLFSSETVQIIVENIYSAFVSTIILYWVISAIVNTK